MNIKHEEEGDDVHTLAQRASTLLLDMLQWKLTEFPFARQSENEIRDSVNEFRIAASRYCHKIGPSLQPDCRSCIETLEWRCVKEGKECSPRVLHTMT